MGGEAVNQLKVESGSGLSEGYGGGGRTLHCEIVYSPKWG
jgi:hypothetical protein